MVKLPECVRQLSVERDITYKGLGDGASDWKEQTVRDVLFQFSWEGSNKVKSMYWQKPGRNKSHRDPSSHAKLQKVNQLKSARIQKTGRLPKEKSVFEVHARLYEGLGV